MRRSEVKPASLPWTASRLRIPVAPVLTCDKSTIGGGKLVLHQTTFCQEPEPSVALASLATPAGVILYKLWLLSGARHSHGPSVGDNPDKPPLYLRHPPCQASCHRRGRPGPVKWTGLRQQF
jgi:hypothetical protein